MVRNIETHHYDEDGLQKRANEDKQACTKHDGRGDLLCQSHLSAPKHRNGYHDEIDIGEHTRDEGDPDNRPCHSTLAHIYGLLAIAGAA